MSERKTAEIKLRVTPSFKAAVQLAAENAGETMSGYMEKATEDRMKSEKAAVSATGFSLEGEPQIGPSLEVFTGSPIYSEVTPWRFARQFSTNINPVTPVAPTAVPASRNDNAEQWVSGGHEKFEVPAKSDKVACEKNCSPWQWCECKAGNA